MRCHASFQAGFGYYILFPFMCKFTATFFLPDVFHCVTFFCLLRILWCRLKETKKEGYTMENRKINEELVGRVAGGLKNLETVMKCRKSGCQ